MKRKEWNIKERKEWNGISRKRMGWKGKGRERKLLDRKERKSSNDVSLSERKENEMGKRKGKAWKKKKRERKGLKLIGMEQNRKERNGKERKIME